MTSKQNLFSSFIADESGQDLIEYALVAALVGLGAIATLKTVATSVNAIFTSISTQLNAALA